MYDKTTAKHIFDLLKGNYYNTKHGGIYMSEKELQDFENSIIEDCGIEITALTE